MANFAKLIVSGETDSGDQERDMNTKFFQFDKALRSNKIGDQCEAIVEIQKELGTIQFPAFINSAFLKFADVFRFGSNLQRLCILRATDHTKKQLSKVTNVEEFLRKIFSVTHSNDPIARAITIRLLGHSAQILSERKNVHHCLLNGLESHDSVEVEAAVWATAAFCAQSRSFATSALDRLSLMVEDLSTPIDLKLKLLTILRHMHYNARMTLKVREICTNLLENYPTRSFVLVILRTLSQLAAMALTDIPEQLALLEQYLIDDPRRAVKLLCLTNMALLAKTAPHMWESKDIQVVCTFVKEKGSSEKLQIAALKVLDSLASSVAVGKFSADEGIPRQNINGSVEMQCCSHAAYHTNNEIASLGTSLLVHLAVCQKRVDLQEQACISLETLLAVLLAEGPSTSPALRRCPLSIINLCASYPSMADRFIDIICTLLPSTPLEKTQPLCECLLAVCSHQRELLPGLVPDLLVILQDSACQQKSSTMLSLMTLLLQACASEELDRDVHSAVTQSLVRMNSWDVYRIGRQATRYGHHALGADIFAELAGKVSSEHLYCWINALRWCCEAESCLKSTSTLPEFVSCISKASNHYQQSIAALKAATIPSHSHTFQIKFLQLRSKVLQVFLQVLRACCSFKTSPPPAIATSLAVTTGNNVHKCGHVVVQLKRCAKSLLDMKAEYSQLYATAFDADDSSLINMRLQEQTCQLMARILDVLTEFPQKTGAKKYSPDLLQESSDLFGGEVVPTECQRWASACDQVYSMVQQLQQVQCIERCAAVLCCTPLCLPRFFYQRLCNTEIRLAVSPFPVSAFDTVSVHYDTHLTITIEGIISQTTLAKKSLRDIKQVKVIVYSTQQSRGQLLDNKKYSEPSIVRLEQLAEPKNDYFCCKALLQFPMPGLHQVTIDTVVLDQTDQEWSTGPKKTFLVKSFDEAVHRQQQLYAAQRQHQRAAQHQQQQQQL
ncbi:hypothetical protein CAPTEDRAFT_184593 [Capitella teleta]|uniref:Integrator complex subunit 7 n=1 Tax=Capitella teleta TaxID=283909 RepID=R7TXX6_CAPTE|nr:hypothetical protein CAPTEDRAFT_184593 [Capitella teleta]|eukprot:ELT98599.1 hypothetical protein CAPTEDRAFT_184593 [Capitella teleta]